jgi:hypothetical protein
VCVVWVCWVCWVLGCVGFWRRASGRTAHWFCAAVHDHDGSLGGERSPVVTCGHVFKRVNQFGTGYSSLQVHLWVQSVMTELSRWLVGRFFVSRAASKRGVAEGVGFMWPVAKKEFFAIFLRGGLVLFTRRQKCVGTKTPLGRLLCVPSVLPFITHKHRHHHTHPVE